MTFERCYRIVVNIGRMHSPRLTVGPSILNLKSALHRMNMGDEHHWWGQYISLRNLIRQDKRNPLRKTLSLQRWALYCKLWDACLDDKIVSKKTGDNIYLKGMFQLEAGSWLIDNLDGCWQDAHNQLETILDRIQEMNDLLSLSMMNQATPHLRAHSCLMNNEKSNHRG